MDEFAPLVVHKVALASLRHQPDPDVEPVLHPTVAVWADLSPLVEQGVEIEHGGRVVVGLRTIDAFATPDPARIGLVVSPALTAEEIERGLSAGDDDSGDEDPDAEDAADEDSDGEGTAAADTADEDAADEDAPLTIASILDPYHPRFHLILPTSTVALAMTLSSMPFAFRLLLLDGAPPAEPEFAVLDIAQVSALVLVAEQSVHDALEGRVPDLLRHPLAYDSDEDAEDDPATTEDSMRALLWSTLAGIALGQPTAFRRLVGFGEWMHELADREDPDTERLGAVLNNATTVQMLSMDAVTEEDAAVDLTALPGPMAALQAQVAATVSANAVSDLIDGVPFPNAVEQYGFAAALPALGALVAARAQAVAAEYADGTTVSWLLATWLDGIHEYPLWTLPSCAPALMYHDTRVFADLLAAQPDGPVEEHGPLLTRFMHALAEAILMMDLDEAALDGALRGLDVAQGNIGDLATLAIRMQWDGLAAAQADNGVCPACAAIEGVLETWEPRTLVPLVAALLPCLADVDAADSGLAVGDAAWVDYRTAFLRNWLHEAA